MTAFTINLYLHEIYIYIFFFICIKSWMLHTKRWFMDITYSRLEEEGQWTRLLDLSPAKLYIFSGQCSFEIRWHPFFFFCALVTSSVPYLILNILLPLNFFQSYPYIWICSKLTIAIIYIDYSGNFCFDWKYYIQNL